MGNTVGSIQNLGTMLVNEEVTPVRPFTVKGAFSNEGDFTVLSMTVFGGALANTGTFHSSVEGIAYAKGFENSGTLEITRTAAFTDLHNLADGTVSFTSGSGKGPW